MSIEWHEALGIVGVVFIVGTYLMLQTSRISSDGVWFSALNGGGASLVLVSLMFDFNLAAFFVEFFWLLISIIGLWRSLRGKTRNDLQYSSDQAQ